MPISHQPRDIISDIIADSSARFPEFATCVRKRIRTFLKSYRRSRKLKDGSIPTMNGIGKVCGGREDGFSDCIGSGGQDECGRDGDLASSIVLRGCVI